MRSVGKRRRSGEPTGQPGDVSTAPIRRYSCENGLLPKHILPGATSAPPRRPQRLRFCCDGIRSSAGLPCVPDRLLELWPPEAQESQGALEPSQRAQASHAALLLVAALARGGIRAACRRRLMPILARPAAHQPTLRANHPLSPCHHGPCCGDRWDSLTSCLSLAPSPREGWRCAVCVIYLGRAHPRRLCCTLPFPPCHRPHEEGTEMSAWSL